ncbi:hypothetical protein CONPUDRAFT_143436 [Coniophora puteana RWD-64-598 SS2]|uniref:Uncharacterized protein n=1 Tax=Coniophora puteana (strain RWD-64-598) TaxID=741705 RepID=A0A5M3MRM4_CONPW|nr:uncharacterized protein CONPUDRAFT_143436 [Coniophora puteana RWD-64-598 SS2]EIW81717.1 hypothetical protein CONPUDRAFT_143436 [Coniophora puteana RWD-64-598 SS2]
MFKIRGSMAYCYTALVAGSICALTIINISILLSRIYETREMFGTTDWFAERLKEKTLYQLPIPLRDVAVNFTNSNGSYGIESAQEWHSLIPTNTVGFVHLGEEDMPFAVSMYHALHCLDTIRRAMSEADEYTCTGKSRNKLDLAMKHSTHCFDYVAQLLLCNADATLEPILAEKVVHHSSAVPAWASAGAGVIHRCRDWTQVRRFVETNRDEKNILPLTD